MAKAINWNINNFSMMVVLMLLNKFDCFIIIEGNRGLGKSTLGYQILRKVNSYFKILRREIPDIMEMVYPNNSKGFYKFLPTKQLKNDRSEKYIIYTREGVINFFNKWNVSAMADEMINVSFNREFWNEDQKNLIKILNMNRDHCNLLLACVPQFTTLDNQIKNLCKIRITIARRGVGVIQTPNRTIYNKDKWDTANNEKIEREWLKKKGGMPQYTKLNTFRGFIKFHPLTEKHQLIYDAIKLKERNVIAKDLGVTEEVTKAGEVVIKEESEEDKAIKKLINGEIKNTSILEGMAFALGKKPENFLRVIRKRLKDSGKDPSLNNYYWDKKAKSERDVEGERMNFQDLLKSVEHS